LIKFIRKGHPALKLGYESNWDRYWKVGFWKDLDFAGVTCYFQLAEDEDPTPTVGQLIEAWHRFAPKAPDSQVVRHKDTLLEWQKTIGKPVVFSEVGYFSRKGTAIEPWNYYRNADKPDKLSMEEQANCYEAFLEVWSDEPILGGVMFHEWAPGGGGPNDAGYTPKGKPAEKILREYFRDKARGKPPAASQGG